MINFRRKLQRQLIKHLPTEPRNDHPHRGIRVDPARLEIEQLILSDFAGARFMFHHSTWFPHGYVGVSVGAGTVADEHRVALGVVARARGAWIDLIAGKGCAI